ncbi:mediator of RNA polymerase II transcription subunit 22 [Paragonimus westermani]|uniref:Mediator of RNA polymerase II transcription subunit 22 n=1 Tax=Paragonimus westermani TaxID=34504 RepID=A0A5J4NEQ7_9TREM|nr:mediator of RNA polymerase II transcription subunit 22 [Paragonimus westermani]
MQSSSSAQRAMGGGSSGMLQLNAARKRDSHVQSLKSRLRMNMNAIVENYESILLRTKIDASTDATGTTGLVSYAQAEQDTFEMSVRAANIVHACENLTRMVSEIKQLLILGDFCWLAQVTSTNCEDLQRRRMDLDRVSLRLRDKLAGDLYAIEEECGGSDGNGSAIAVVPTAIAEPNRTKATPMPTALMTNPS